MGGEMIQFIWTDFLVKLGPWCQHDLGLPSLKKGSFLEGISPKIPQRSTDWLSWNHHLENRYVAHIGLEADDWVPRVKNGAVTKRIGYLL